MLLLECPTLLWLLTSFQKLESVTSYNPDLAREDSRCNDNLVRQDSSLRNWGRWGRPLQRVWCELRVPHSPVVSGASMASSQALLVNAFPRRIRDERPRGACMWPKTQRAPGKWGTWQLRLNGRRQWRSNYKARGRVEKGSKFMIFKYTGPWIRRHEYMKLSRSGVGYGFPTKLT